MSIGPQIGMAYKISKHQQKAQKALRTQYLERNEFLTQEKAGFRALHSSTTCLLKCTDEWYSGMDKELLTGLISRDLKKAFDLVDHKILCQKTRALWCCR